MQTYKTIFWIFLSLFAIGIGAGEINCLMIGMLSSLPMALYSVIMFLCGYRSWMLLWGFLAGVAGLFFFGMLLAALATFT